MPRKPQTPTKLPTSEENPSQSEPISSPIENIIHRVSSAKEDPLRDIHSGGTVAGEPVVTGRTDSNHPLKRGDTPRIGKNTTFLLREAARSEALKFMPAVSKILSGPKVNVNTKLRLFELL